MIVKVNQDQTGVRLWICQKKTMEIIQPIRLMLALRRAGISVLMRLQEEILMIDLTGKSVFVKTQGEYLSVIKMAKGIIADSIQHYGKNNQSTVCMEECAELIQAISKAKRGKIDRDNMIEEIADVLLCIEMLKQMYMISDEKINKWIEKKQAREAERMKKNE